MNILKTVANWQADLGIWMIKYGAKLCFLPNMDIKSSPDGQQMVVVLTNLPIKSEGDDNPGVVIKTMVEERSMGEAEWKKPTLN